MQPGSLLKPKGGFVTWSSFEDEEDLGRMNPLPRPLMVIASVLLVIKATRHPRRALRRVREILRETRVQADD